MGLGLFMYPKYHFLKLGGSTFSLGMPITLGINPNVQSNTVTRLGFAYEAGLFFDVNGGKLSADDYAADARMGYF